MEEKTQIQILISSVFALIINLSFSITELLRQALAEIPKVSGYEWLNSLLILCFFVAEIAVIYGILFKILNLGGLIE